MATQYGLNFTGVVRIFRKDKTVAAAGSKKTYDIHDFWINISEKNEDGTYFNKSMPVIFKRGLELPENNSLIMIAGFPMITGNVKGDRDYRRVALYVQEWEAAEK